MQSFTCSLNIYWKLNFTSIFLNLILFWALDVRLTLMAITLQCVAYSTKKVPQNAALRLLNKLIPITHFLKEC